MYRWNLKKPIKYQNYKSKVKVTWFFGHLWYPQAVFSVERGKVLLANLVTDYTHLKLSKRRENNYSDYSSCQLKQTKYWNEWIYGLYVGRK